MGYYIWVEHDENGVETGRRNDHIDERRIFPEPVFVPIFEGQPHWSGVEYHEMPVDDYPSLIDAFFAPPVRAYRSEDLTFVDG